MATRLTSQTVAQDEVSFLLTLRKNLILRRPQGGRLEGPTDTTPASL